MECGFVLEPVGAESEWLSVKASCDLLAADAAEKAEQAEKDEDIKGYQALQEYFADISARCSGKEEAKLRIVSKKDRNRWVGDDGDSNALRSGLADLRGFGGGMAVGDDGFFASLECHEIARVLVTMVARYNRLDANQRAGFFTQARG